jgi:hypothetical protein
MFQIIWNKDNARWEIKDTSDYYIKTEDTFHNYKFFTEEDALGVYISKIMDNVDGFDREYIIELTT